MSGLCGAGHQVDDEGVVLFHVPLVGVVIVGCVYMCVLASLGGKMHILCDRCCPSAESSVLLGGPVSTLGLNCSVAQWWQTESDSIRLVGTFQSVLPPETAGGALCSRGPAVGSKTTGRAREEGAFVAPVRRRRS